MRNKKLVFSVIVMFIVLIGIFFVAYINRISNFNLYRPMVYVLDKLYADCGTSVDKLPDDAIYIGKIKKVVLQTEAMVLENFTANVSIMENEIYISDDSPDKIYIKILIDKKEKFMVYIQIE